MVRSFVSGACLSVLALVICCSFVMAEHRVVISETSLRAMVVEAVGATPSRLSISSANESSTAETPLAAGGFVPPPGWVVYNNQADAVLAIYLPNSETSGSCSASGIQPMADDLRLSGGGCTVTGYSLLVGGIASCGSSRFRVDTELWDGNPCDSASSVIPGTSAVFPSIPNSHTASELFTELAVRTPVPETVWLRVKFWTEDSGWILAGDTIDITNSKIPPSVPDIGNTDDTWSEDDVSGCGLYSFLSGNYGGFWATVWCGNEEPLGACCDSSAGECVPDVIESKCLGDGQYWLERTLCEATDCGAALGSCCFEDLDQIETCKDLPNSICAVVGNQSEAREWQSGKLCGVNNQSCPLIGCIRRDGHCFEPHVDHGCKDPSCCSSVCRADFDDFCCRAEWDEACVNIARNTCDLGACCELRTGTCLDDVSSSECAGETESYNPGMLCSAITCEPAVGACCDMTAGGGADCVDDVLLDDCVGFHLQFSADETCDVANCAEFTGSCCDRRHGTCISGVEVGACGATADQWNRGTTCGEVNCSAESAACCDRLHGTCTRSTFAECACDDCEWLVGERCEDVVCNAGFLPIPTTSQWGLAVLALLLLSAAKIAFARTTEATE